MKQRRTYWARLFRVATRWVTTVVVFGVMGFPAGMLLPSATFAAEVPLGEFAKKPDRFVDQTITMQGTLKFVGKNYFSDPVAQFVIEDSDGNQVPVTPWLPLEVAPLAPGELGPSERPQIMSDYLDKKVRVRGKVRFEPHKNKHEVTPDSVEKIPSE